MKVSSLLKILEGRSPDENICALIWLKEDMYNPTDDEYALSNEAWTEICKEFDEWENAGTEISEWIMDAIIEKTDFLAVTIMTSAEGEEKTGFLIDMWDRRDDKEKSETRE